MNSTNGPRVAAGERDMSGFSFYLSGSWVFLIALCAGEHLMTPAGHRREKYALRFALSFLAQAAIAFPVTWVYFIVASAGGVLAANIAAVAAYVVMFLVSLAGMRLCFAGPFRECVLSGVAAYAAQHIGYNLFGLVNYNNALMAACYTLGAGAGYAASTLIQLAVFAAVLAAVRLVFAPRGEGDGNIQNGSVTQLAAATLFIVLVANGVRSVYAAESAALSALCSVLLICCCIFILFLRSDMLERRRLKQEIGVIESLRAKELRHYEQLKSNIDLVNVKCHDIKHYIDRAGAGGGIDPEELKDLVNIYDSEMETGNETLDIVLSEYRIYCNSHGILFTAFADGAALRYMNVSDICSLFGNIMENAVEACERVMDTERRVISLNVRSVAGQVSVCAENYFEGEVKFADGLPVTGKEDTFRHGYGVKSIRMIAEKYGGSMQCSARDGLFRVSVLFPVPSERKDRV